MKIALNSAYVQTETLNFTFARQAVSCIYIFVPTADVLNARGYRHYDNTTLLPGLAKQLATVTKPKRRKWCYIFAHYS